MSEPSRGAAIPPPFQTGFIVPDLNAAALRYWTEVVGAGPFFVFPSNDWKELYYNGATTHVDSMMAIGFWGDMQIEFIQQANDTPSPYTTFTKAGHSGPHHFGSMVDDLDFYVAKLAELGKQRVYWGEASVGVRFAYLVEDEHPGAMIELIEHGPVTDGLMQMVREAAWDWDGNDPIRQLGQENQRT